MSELETGGPGRTRPASSNRTRPAGSNQVVRHVTQATPSRSDAGLAAAGPRGIGMCPGPASDSTVTGLPGSLTGAGLCRRG